MAVITAVFPVITAVIKSNKNVRFIAVITAVITAVIFRNQQ